MRSLPKQMIMIIITSLIPEQSSTLNSYVGGASAFEAPIGHCTSRKLAGPSKFSTCQARPVVGGDEIEDSAGAVVDLHVKMPASSAAQSAVVCKGPEASHDQNPADAQNHVNN